MYRVETQKSDLIQGRQRFLFLFFLPKVRKKVLAADRFSIFLPADDLCKGVHIVLLAQ